MYPYNFTQKLLDFVELLLIIPHSPHSGKLVNLIKKSTSLAVKTFQTNIFQQKFSTLIKTKSDALNLITHSKVLI